MGGVGSCTGGVGGTSGGAVGDDCGDGGTTSPILYMFYMETDCLTFYLL